MPHSTLSATLLTYLLLFGARSASAGEQAESAYEPAGFGNQRERILRMLPSVELEEGETLVVRCNALVESSGGLGRIACLPDAAHLFESRVVVQSVKRALESRRLRAARVDGRRIPVWFVFAVRYVGTAEGTSPSLHRSLLVRPVEASPGYVSAQRFRPVSWRCAGSRPIALVVEDGSPGSSHVPEASRGAECPERARRLLEGARYVPAHLDGVPVTSLYTEFFF